MLKSGKIGLRILKAFAETEDFNAAYRLVSEFKSELGAKPKGDAVRELLKKSTKDRLVTSFINSVGFGVRPFAESVGRLGRLLSFQPGTLVLNSAWGLGEIKRLDAFYRRVTVDFRTRRGHQLTFDAACETLVLAPENHILVTAKADPDRIQKMLKEEPGTFVKEMLGSFGNMPITRLEELSAQHGFVKAANWKSFWERARADLRKDKLVEIPTRRAEPLVLKAAAESYGDGWFTAFEQMTDPKSILTAIREFVGAGKFKGLDTAGRAKIADRLAFALKGARKVDDALYARLAACLAELKLDDAVAAKARSYLWTESRYLAAARDLPASEMSRLVEFLVAENEALAMQDSGSKSLAYLFMDLNTLAYNHRDVLGDGVHAYLDALQAELIAQQESVDAKMQATPAGAARNALANEAHRAASELVYERCNTLLNEVRAYLEAGDTSTPFVASDLAADGTLATPVTYAADMDAFDAEAAAANVTEPEYVELLPEATEEAEDEEAVEEEATEEAEEESAPAEPQPLTGANYGLFAFLAAFAALVLTRKKN